MSKVINTLRINKLYSEPQIFDEIIFDLGLNLIVGERGEGDDVQSRKTNSVGKSLCVDFIRFALLKKFSDTRIDLIPEGKINKDAWVCLDVSFEENDFVIKRHLKNPKKVIVKTDTSEVFLDEKDAKKYLESLLYKKEFLGERPSFRNLISGLTREEASNFVDILRYYDPKITNNADYENILYYIGVDLNEYKKVKAIKQEIEKIVSIKKEYLRKLEAQTGKKIKEIQSDIFLKRKEVKEIQECLDDYKTDDIYKTIEDDINKNETVIERLRIIRSKLKHEICAIESMPEMKKIDVDDIGKVYNFFKKDLGDYIINSLEKTIAFKEKIERFQKELLEVELKKLKNELIDVEKRINIIGEEIAKSYAILSGRGALKELKISLRALEKKKDTLKEIESLFEKYEEQVALFDVKEIEMKQCLIVLKQCVKNAQETIESFLNSITSIQETIMGTRENCAFSLFLKEKSKSKEVLDYTYRIKDDGGHSIDKEKTFIYDIALMLNSKTSIRHPKFLLHDGIFEVDNDTLVKSLNYVWKNSKAYDFQYIVAINKDKLDNENFDFDIEEVIKASYTKANKFLKVNYQEEEKKRKSENEE